MDLSTMSISQLRDLQQQIPVEIKRREAEEKVNALNELRAFAKSRGYAIGAARIFGATPTSIADIRSHAYNADLVKQLSPEMQAKLASYGTPLN